MGNVRCRRALAILFTLISCPVGMSTLPSVAYGQVPIIAFPDPASLLSDADPSLARNKRLVYDFWRVVLEAGHYEDAARYAAESYIQHNPNVPSGLVGLRDYIRRNVRPTPITNSLRTPLVAIVASGDKVVFCVAEGPSSSTTPTTYSAASFDMFRVENGKIVEHWDSASKAQ